MSKISNEKAKKILSNTSPEKAFWVNRGPTIKSIIELATAAKKLTAEQFLHHVNSTKNDFAKWVNEVIGDSELAKKISKVKSKDELSRTVTSRLKSLQKLIN